MNPQYNQMNNLNNQIQYQTQPNNNNLTQYPNNTNIYPNYNNNPPNNNVNLQYQNYMYQNSNIPINNNLVYPNNQYVQIGNPIANPIGNQNHKQYMANQQQYLYSQPNVSSSPPLSPPPGSITNQPSHYTKYVQYATEPQYLPQYVQQQQYVQQYVQPQQYYQQYPPSLQPQISYPPQQQIKYTQSPPPPHSIPSPSISSPGPVKPKKKFPDYPYPSYPNDINSVVVDVTNIPEDKKDRYIEKRQERYSVHVSNLNPNVKGEDLKKLFIKYGRIIDVHFPRRVFYLYFRILRNQKVMLMSIIMKKKVLINH